MQKQRICVVVVTYNRLLLLQKTIAGINAQTIRPEKIIVVNNGSTDGTREWLNEQSSIKAVHQANVGGAGGFRTGVQQSLQAGADWIWMMDDDVAPEQDCLETMLQFTSVSQCINPIHLSVDGTLSDEERWFDATSCTIVNLFNHSYRYGKKIWYRNLGSFEGMLVSRELVEKIGLPDERFFIAHDDLVYGYLASRFTNVLVVADAVIRRQPVVKSMGGSYNYDYYYMYRNLWLLEEYAQRELPQFNHYRKRRIFLQFLYAVYKIFFVDKPQYKGKALSTLYTAFADYRKKKPGKKE